MKYFILLNSQKIPLVNLKSSLGSSDRFTFIALTDLPLHQPQVEEYLRLRCLDTLCPHLESYA